MCKHELAKLALPGMKNNWVEESQTTVLQKKYDGEEECFEDII